MVLLIIQMLLLKVVFVADVIFSSISVREVLSAKCPYKRVVFPSPYWDKISDAAKVSQY